MSERGWSEEVMGFVFYGEDHLVDLTEVWIESVGDKRAKLYLERRFLGNGVIDLEQYEILKKKADEARQQMERAQGSLDTLTRQLKSEFDCDTVQEAENLLESLQGKVEKTEKEYDEALSKFNEKWADRINEGSD